MLLNSAPAGFENWNLLRRSCNVYLPAVFICTLYT